MASSSSLRGAASAVRVAALVDRGCGHVFVQDAIFQDIVELSKRARKVHGKHNIQILECSFYLWTNCQVHLRRLQCCPC